jgi:hypothetical protein
MSDNNYSDEDEDETAVRLPLDPDAIENQLQRSVCDRAKIDPYVKAGEPFIENRTKTKNEAKHLKECRLQQYVKLSTLGKKPMEIYRQIVKSENPDLGKRDENFEKKVTLIKQDFYRYRKISKNR